MGHSGNRHLEAVDVQLRLLDTWTTDDGLLQAQAWLKREAELREMYVAQGRGHELATMSFDGDPRFGATPDMVMAKAMYEALNRSQTYWVSADMVAMIHRAVPEMPVEPVAPMDMPSPSGFVFLETPHYGFDTFGKRCNVRAIMWTPTYFHVPNVGGTNKIGAARAINVTYFSDYEDEQDEGWGTDSIEERRLSFGRNRWRLLHTALWPWKVSAADDAERMEIRIGEYGQRHDWAPGTFEEYPIDPDVRLHHQWDNFGGQFLTGLWRIATQSIVQVSTHPYDRAARRRLDRVKLPRVPEWGDVRTIDLRRLHEASHAGDDHDRPGFEPTEDRESWYSYRFSVTHHWKRQWYPSEGRHKWIYIDDYDKGPEDAPYVARDNLYRVVR